MKALKQNQSVLLVTPTWNEIEAVTEKVRAALKASGRLTEEILRGSLQSGKPILVTSDKEKLLFNQKLAAVDAGAMAS